MSHSYWHTPYIGVCGRCSCKNWRTQENRRYRAYTKNLLRHEKYDYIMSYKKKWQNPWVGPTDGSYWFGDMEKTECSSYSYFKWGLEIQHCTPEKNYHNCKLEYAKMMRK